MTTFYFVFNSSAHSLLYQTNVSPFVTWCQLIPSTTVHCRSCHFVALHAPHPTPPSFFHSLYIFPLDPPITLTPLLFHPTELQFAIHSEEGLMLETSALNFLYSGQFTFSCRSTLSLDKPNIISLNSPTDAAPQFL